MGNNRIRELKEEIENLRRKLRQSNETIRQQRDMISSAALTEIQMAADALVIHVTQKYGVAVVDEETGEVSYRLRLPGYNIEELIRHWEAHARRDGRKGEDAYIIDVTAREQKS